MANFELRLKVVELLSTHPEQRFRARDIAIWVAEHYPEAAEEKKARSGRFQNHGQFLGQLVAEIGANRPQWQRQHPQLRSTEGVRPRLFFWSDRTEEQEIASAERDGYSDASVTNPNNAAHTPPVKLTESDLYPLLIQYLESEYHAKGFRIDEKRSSNSAGSGGNKWLFPDVVGLEDLTSDMEQEVVSAIRESKDKQVRLWSFEVKLLINRSNARETYFQAVSNSSWANFGYLVASAFEGADTLKELNILYAVHGIGIIRLDVDEPSESEILVPARQRADIEWPMCSRLSHENRDFRAYMKTVRQFFQTGDM